MAEYISREALLQDIEDSVRFTAKTGTISPEIRGANKVIDRIKCAPVADVAPVSELEKLRDTLYENDWIFFNGLSELNKLIERYKRNNEVSE